MLLGATGFTGRQAVRAVLKQRPDARWAVAGRDAARLRALVAKMVPAGARAPEVIVADTRDAASLQALARQAQVLFNLAGPYHATGDAVVAACIAGGTHYLDLIGETFWIQRLVREQHDAAQRARVKIIPCAGYEALPFDLATLWAAHQLRQQCGEPCASVKIVVRFTGRPSTRPQDIVSGGTAATMTELLAHDHTDCLRNMACLLPPDAPDAAGVARRNALHWLPRYDADLQAVIGADDARPLHQPAGGAARRGADATTRRSSPPTSATTRAPTWAACCPVASCCRRRVSLALQWAAAAAVAAPLANLGATIAGPLQFQRHLLGPLLERVAPKPGTGPREARARCHRLRARGLRAWRQRRALSRPRRRCRSPGLPLDAGDGGVRGLRPGRRHARPHGAVRRGVAGRGSGHRGGAGAGRRWRELHAGAVAPPADSRRDCRRSTSSSRPLSPSAASTSPAVEATQKPRAPSSARGVWPLRSKAST